MASGSGAPTSRLATVSVAEGSSDTTRSCWPTCCAMSSALEWHYHSWCRLHCLPPAQPLPPLSQPLAPLGSCSPDAIGSAAVSCPVGAGALGRRWRAVGAAKTGLSHRTPASCCPQACPSVAVLQGVVVRQPEPMHGVVSSSVWLRLPTVPACRPH